MKKELCVFLLPVCMMACSQESGVGETAGAAVDMDSFNVLPVFAFGEDGSRYDFDIESGKKTKREMARERLVVADENEFASLKQKYRRLLDSEGASQTEYPVNYYCKAELLAINAEYSEVVTSDGKVLLDDASLLEGCVDISKNETLAKTTTYTDYPNTHTVTQFPIKMYVESDFESVADGWEPTGVTAAYLYYKESYVPYEPRYAAVYTASFKKSACTENFLGIFVCDRALETVRTSGLCYFNEGDSYVNGYHCYKPNGKQYGKYQNRTYRSWSIEANNVGNLSSNKKEVGIISLHAIVHGKDTLFFRTGMNVDKVLGDKFYNRYLSDINPLESYEPR